jgi:hypothetical protein
VLEQHSDAVTSVCRACGDTGRYPGGFGIRRGV